MEELIPKIGLEIHLELETKSKLFCNCPNPIYGNKDITELTPNSFICSICVGQPGVLPVVNKQAVVYAYSLAKVLKMTINNKSIFARKHYFYPDLPKGYQISQYELPLAINGEVILFNNNLHKKIKIRRLHIEEDTAKTIHYDKYSLIDFNRSGIPLIEIVTEPDFNSVDEVVLFAEDFVLLIRHLGISSADLEKGQIRFEANISLGKGQALGTKVEIKNIGSIQSLKDAVIYEINRQKEIISNNKIIIQETRGFDEIKRVTFSQRIKEEAEDYRYFPEPDLPPLVIDEEIIKESLSIETPWDKKIRFNQEYELNINICEILVKDKILSHFFEESFSELYKLTNNKEKTKELITNFLVNDIIGFIEKKFKTDNKNTRQIDLEKFIKPHEFAHLLFNFLQGKISSKIVKEALEKSIGGELQIEEFIKAREKISDIEILNTVIDDIIKENNKTVNEYLNGNQKSFEFLIGQIMKKTQGRADPILIRNILKDKLNDIEKVKK